MDKQVTHAGVTAADELAALHVKIERDARNGEQLVLEHLAWAADLHAAIAAPAGVEPLLPEQILALAHQVHISTSAGHWNGQLIAFARLVEDAVIASRSAGAAWIRLEKALKGAPQ